jgi:hypothetical protein
LHQSEAVIRVLNAPREGGGVQISYGSPNYFKFRGSPPRAEPSIGYVPGTNNPLYPTNPFDEVGADFGYVDVIWLKNLDRDASAHVELTWTRDVVSTISAPTSATTNQWITVSATPSNYKAPVAYRWYINGSLSSMTGSGFQFVSGTVGTATFRVEVRDAEGDWGDATASVAISASSTGGGGTGGGGGGGGSGCTPTASMEPRQPAPMVYEVVPGLTPPDTPAFAQEIPCDP